MPDDRFLGPYRLGEPVGHGGMGTVYRAVHANTQDVVAVKLIAEHVANSEQFRRRFASEVESLKRMDHPHIASLIGYGEEQGRPFYVMELVSGPTLQQRLKDENRLSWRETIDIAVDISSALHHAHALGIIHRDLKPANLLFDAQHRIKLVDFGIHKFWDSHTTAIGSVLGTADYMAPEQSGNSDISYRTDFYALGNVMYACLSGRPPFTGSDLTQVLHQLQTKTPRPLRQRVPEIPKELAELVHQLLEKSPQNRPPTAHVIHNRLKAMKVGLSHSQKSDSNTQNKNDINHLDPLEDNRDDPTTLADSDLMGDRAHLLTVDSGTNGTSGNIQKTEFGGGGDDFTLQPECPTPSHYQTIDAAERRRIVLNESAQASSYDWRQWASIGLLTAILIALIGSAFWITRTPSAEQLYETISASDAAGKASDQIENIETFLQTYPKHPLSPQVQAIADSLDRDRMVRRLRRQAIQSGGVEYLEPAKQPLLRAMTLQPKDPTEAERLFKLWLDVYDHDAKLFSPEILRLRHLVKGELARLQNLSKPKEDSRGQELQRVIRWSRTDLPPEQRIPLLQGIIELYSNQEWAQQAVQQARSELTLDNPLKDETPQTTPEPKL